MTICINTYEADKVKLIELQLKLDNAYILLGMVG